MFTVTHMSQLNSQQQLAQLQQMFLSQQYLFMQQQQAYYLQQSYQQQYPMFIPQQAPTGMVSQIGSQNTVITDNQKCENKEIKKEPIQQQQQIQVKNEEESKNSENLSKQEDDDEDKLPGGHWTQEEHEKYLEFVDNHKDVFRSKYQKKSKKIFKLMAFFIPTRTATQCRSHHQKFNPLNRKNNRKRRRRLVNSYQKPEAKSSQQ